MGLVGSLEDLSLLDILQIVNVSRRTGILKVHPAGGDACFVHFQGGGIQIKGSHAFPRFNCPSRKCISPTKPSSTPMTRSASSSS